MVSTTTKWGHTSGVLRAAQWETYCSSRRWENMVQTDRALPSSSWSQDRGPYLLRLLLSQRCQKEGKGGPGTGMGPQALHEGL